MSAPGFGLKEPFPGYPPPMTTRPEGLLSMLGLQTAGRYPQHLQMDWLQPTLDLTTFYAESRAEIQNFTGNISALTAGNFLQLWQVPPGELWYLLALSVNWTAASTTAPGSYTLCRARANDNSSRLGLGPPYLPAANELPLISYDFSARGLILRPTVQIGLHYGGGGTVSGSPAIAGTVRFVRMQC